MSSASPAPSRLDLLAAMLRIRAYEERIVAFHDEGPFPHVCTSVGQEAAAVGVVSALRPDDQILTNHRSAGHLLARGADPGRLLAEVMGRSTGYCKGKSGTLHISAKELGVILTSTIVGGELSLAPGVALSRSMLGGEGIVVCFFGDGAACEGIFHESLNLASVWNLPVLYVCENNQWQAFVHRKETMTGDHVGPWAAAYGMDHLTVDGNDVEAVLEAATCAAAQVRQTRRPFLLEASTYRQRGHMEPHDQSYVDPAEIEAWLAKDPIDRLSARLLDAGELTPQGLEALRLQAREAMNAAAAFAQASPFPDPSELTTDVYA
ncbi:MAG: thiamine pyrophosphate-dependent dehydrogenase E1 component subunit alpha [Acidobacteria bacterium]|nr:thiamine pyrophosphate-dependent dehydrogenase E1 component subunit alpha [Acidobacteriota bacterium]MBI3489693.1 thiamine pyrophosphate-dependent dehydrogenase E1 component subunit alpha [Acidobacteriota bacterium]